MGTQYCLAKAKNLLLLPVPLFFITFEVSVACFGREQVTSLNLPCSLNFILFYMNVFIMCVNVYVFGWMCVHMHMYVHVWRPEVSLRCFYPLGFFFFLRGWGAVSPVTWSLLIKPGQLATESQRIPISTFPSPGIQACTTLLSLFMWMLWLNRRPLHLYNKHFANCASPWPS